MDSLPIMIPARPGEAKRPPLPFVSALVPVAAGVVLWLVTGSLYALCFAALGPLMIGGSLIDGLRARARARRAAEEESEAAWARADSDLAQRHEDERRGRHQRNPDAAACLSQPPLRGAETVDTATELVVGRGVVRSEVRSSGGDDARARAFQERCSVLDDAPIVVGLGGGVCLRGADPVVLSVLRALVVQLRARFSSAQLELSGDRLSDWGVSGFASLGGARRGAFRLAVARVGDTRPPVDAMLWVGSLDDDVPEGVTTVLDIVEPRVSTLRTARGTREIEAEGISVAQAEAVAVTLPEGHGEVALPESIALAELSRPAARDGLPACLGLGEHGEVVLDIVGDGPHAIVTGTTGTGKSELLVSWVTAIAAVNGPDRVLFVLADFKGGTAFEPLRVLPQVSAVITDLDEAGARRGVSSLTAELRRREGVLAAAGVRDIREVAMPRLVIVVDEFAALLQEHSDLAAVFTDIAARGRALGMHLIIGTQRAAGVIRDALAANCPLRVSLRVGDPADSRAVIGTDAAAELPGGAASRGLALVRRPQDAEPALVRVALTSAADLRWVEMRWPRAELAQSPWLPALDTRIPLEALRGHAQPGTVILGRSDDPEHQRQPVESLRIGVDRGLAVIGSPGSGRTMLIRALRHQRPDALLVPGDVEAAWDTVDALATGRIAVPDLVLCDDLDALTAELPAEHAQRFIQNWERILRSYGETTFVLTAMRTAGPIGRLLDALPRRALLRLTSRVEHLAAGGDSGTYDRDRPVGRASIGDREVQFAWVDDAPVGAAVPVTEALTWVPTAEITAIVTSGAASLVRGLEAAYPDCEVALPPAVPTGAHSRAILVADAETWQRNWTLWQRARAQGEVLIRAENPADLRQLAAIRETPPFARTHAGRAWSLRDADTPRRVVVPALSGR